MKDAPLRTENFWSAYKSEACVFALAAGMVVLLTVLRGHMLGLDGFYHIRMAELYQSGAIAQAGENFHWTQQSLWNGAFSDKDFLWHILLIPFIWVFGSDPSGLEHAAVAGAACSAGAIAAILVGVLRRRGVAMPLLWGMVLLAASTTLTYRLALPRSYLLSMMAALLGWHWIDRRYYKRLGALAVAYTLAYTAPHLLFVLAAIWAIVELGKMRAEGTPFVKGSAKVWHPFVAILAGIIVGVALHPHPLNLVRLWVVQNLMVPAHANGFDGIARSLGNLAGYALPADVMNASDIGGEMNSLDARSLLFSEMGGFVLFVGPWVYAALRKARPRALDGYAWLCASLFFVMMMSSERFAEYFYPFVTLAAALLVDHANRSGEPFSTSWGVRMAKFPTFALTVLALIVVARPVVLWRQLAPRKVALGSALDAVGKLPAGSRVFHSDWGDFTQLFFKHPELDYLIGLDPTFFYVGRPENYALFEGLKRGETPPGRSADSIIREEMGMRYALVREKHKALKLMLQRAANGYVKTATLLASDEAAGWWLYDLGEAAGK